MKRHRLRTGLIILGVVFAVILIWLIGTSANAASGMPEFPLIIQNNLDAFIEFIKNNLKILDLIW